MILMHRVALDGAWLDEIDSRIIVQGVEEASGKNTLNAVSLMGSQGQRITKRHRDSLEIKVRFALQIRKKEMGERETLFEKIATWAAKAAEGAWLTLNYKENRRIRVVLAEMPALGDPWNWAAAYTIIFRAYGVPYWTDDTPVIMTTNAVTRAELNLSVTGNVDTLAEITIRNMSGSTVNTIGIWTARDQFEFAGLGLGASESLIIDHDGEGFLRIRITGNGKTRSAMGKRTEDSTDELRLRPGADVAGFTSQRSCQMTVTFRGRYL